MTRDVCGATKKLDISVNLNLIGGCLRQSMINLSAPSCSFHAGNFVTREDAGDWKFPPVDMKCLVL